MADFEEWQAAKDLPETKQGLIDLIKASFKDDEKDNIARIKVRYFPIGEAWNRLKALAAKDIEAAGGREPYCKAVIGWSYVMVNDCFNAWMVRDKFAVALAWYRDPGRNDSWKPKKPTGPRFVVELVNWHTNKDKPDTARKTTRAKPSELLAKQMTELNESLAKTEDKRKAANKQVEDLDFKLASEQNLIKAMAEWTVERFKEWQAEYHAAQVATDKADDASKPLEPATDTITPESDTEASEPSDEDFAAKIAAASPSGNPATPESDTEASDNALAAVSLPGCNYIYAPKGQAGEYSPLAANPYRGCGHGCAYCYVPLMLHMKRAKFDEGAVLRSNFFNNLRKDAVKYQAAGITEQVMISFTSDPYHLGDTMPTRQTLEILRDHGLGFYTLSKGGTRALRDLDLFRPDRDAYAATLTSLDDTFSLKWERHAALPADRIATLKAFHDAGIFTWVSLEPTLDIESSLEIVRATHGFVDLFKVGKANYLGEFSKTKDWKGYTERMIELMAELGQAHYIKKDLQGYLPEGYHNPLRIAQYHTATIAPEPVGDIDKDFAAAFGDQLPPSYRKAPAIPETSPTMRELWAGRDASHSPREKIKKQTASAGIKLKGGYWSHAYCVEMAAQIDKQKSEVVLDDTLSKAPAKGRKPVTEAVSAASEPPKTAAHVMLSKFDKFKSSSASPLSWSHWTGGIHDGDSDYLSMYFDGERVAIIGFTLEKFYAVDFDWPDRHLDIDNGFKKLNDAFSWLWEIERQNQAASPDPATATPGADWIAASDASEAQKEARSKAERENKAKGDEFVRLRKEEAAAKRKATREAKNSKGGRFQG